MSSTDINLAASALAIALVALIIAVGQLLQQYLATADGYRRCQMSVMGDWAKMTRLRWRWSEFRLETLFTTPEIFLSGDGVPIKEAQVTITGSLKSRKRTFMPSSSLTDEVDARSAANENTGVGALALLRIFYSLKTITKFKWPGSGRNRLSHSPSDELACWLPLLDQIHKTTQLSSSGTNFTLANLRIPALVFRERSWDFQPPDVVRPLAKTTVADIAVIARRMGMRWKDFRPGDGVLRAEGHSHIITSTVVRSLGIVIQYSYTGQGRRLQMAERNLGRAGVHYIQSERDEIYIPRARSDRLGGGVLRGEQMLQVPDITVGTQQEIVVALRRLDRSGESAAKLAIILRENPGFHFRIADICAFTLGTVRQRGSGLVQVPAPSDSVYGVTTSPHGRWMFKYCLESHVQQQQQQEKQIGQQTREVLNMCYDLSISYPEWDRLGLDAEIDEEWAVTRNIEYLEKVHDTFDAMTEYLRVMNHRMNVRDSKLRYVDLLGVHLRLGVFCADGETTPVGAEIPRYKDDVGRYFEQLPAIIAEMYKTSDMDQEQVVDAWTTMMLRAFCWGACHFLVPGERVPTAYYGSQQPVYIG
ncbi:hypothetical protein MMC11_005524 [Xylographa trunciseda]|nr:hypothetical protein [Xylographa trunciseda]